MLRGPDTLARPAPAGELQAARARRAGLPGGWRRAPLLLRVLSLLSLLGAWSLLSLLLGGEVLPGPGPTLQELWTQLRTGELLHHTAVTLARVVAGFSLAMAAGVLLGAGMGVSRALDGLGEVWLVTGLAIPRIVPIVGAYLLIGLNDAAAVAAIVLTVVPTVVVQLREGVRAVDGRLVEMARAFRRRPAAIWRQVILPQLYPYLVGTARGALSLTWKMVVFAELMGRTNGVGYQISYYFQMWDMKGILAYALAMVILLAAVDLGLLGALERRAHRWRPRLERAGAA